jgi:hypothetical protein
MAVLPQFEPAAQDKTVAITIPAALVPYMDYIQSIAAPEKTQEQWLSDYLVLKGKEFLAATIANQIEDQAESGKITAMQQMALEIQALVGE